jgi:hypothetical protein
VVAVEKFAMTLLVNEVPALVNRMLLKLKLELVSVQILDNLAPPVVAGKTGAVAVSPNIGIVKATSLMATRVQPPPSVVISQ